MARKHPEGKYVYLHIRKSDGLVFYVGQGVNYRAWGKNDRSSHWRNTVSKHGYFVEIVDSGISKSEADSMEIFLISLLSSAGHPLVNKTLGGEGAHGRVVSEKNLIAVSKPVYSSLGEYFRSGADAVRAMISIGYKASSISSISSAISRGHAAFDRTWSYDDFPEHTAMNYEDRMKILHSSKNRMVYCSSGDSFPSVMEAVKWLRSNGSTLASHSSIAQCARSGRGSAYGFAWSYDGVPDHPEFIGVMASARAKSRPVVSERDGWFASASSAARHLAENGYPNAVRSSITSCCKGNLNSAYGTVWKYADEQD